jgi:hypothetical protein
LTEALEKEVFGDDQAAIEAARAEARAEVLKEMPDVAEMIQAARAEALKDMPRRMTTLEK